MAAQDLVPCLQAGSRFGKFCFSHDSKYIFCCCGSVVKVFNTTNGECIHDLKAHVKVVTGVSLNPSNALQLFSCGQDGRLIVWDYLDGEKLKEHDFHMPLRGIVNVSADSKSIMMVAETSVHKKTYSLLQWKKGKTEQTYSSKPKTLIENCGKDCSLVSFGCSNEFIASGSHTHLTVYSMKKDTTRSMTDPEKNKKRDITCVACHPNEYIIATGLNNGMILLWHNFFNKNTPVISRLHWHANTCLSLAFTPDGSNLMSGGHECVLVKWQMGTELRDFKPRMGAPLTQVLCSPDGSFYATAHSDNVVQLLNVSLKVLQVYRGLTRGSIGLHPAKNPDRNPIPCGLTFDPRSQSLVTNGLPGHLQFYSLGLNRQLYNLDIVGQNYISPENVDQPVVITQVTSVAVSGRGEWLATFETWDDGHFTPEERLKFWCWSSEAQTYSLNTTVECPHDGKVTAMTFRPHSNNPDQPAALVTIGSDCCYKKWVLVDDTDIYRSNSRWDCESVGFYRGLEASCATFSSDSTTLAVGFGHLTTLWEPDNNIVHVALAHSLPDRQPIRQLLFGNHACAHYIAATTSKTLLIWDLLTLTVTWSLDTEVTVLLQDPTSDLMACVTSDLSVKVFRPGSSAMVYSHDNVSSSAVLSAVFIPHGRHSDITDVGWPGSSQIYMFNTDEELITLDYQTQDSGREKVKLAQNLPQSAMKAFMAEKMVREKESGETKVPLNTWQKGNDEFISALLHSNEPVVAMCDPFIKSLLVKSGKPSLQDSGNESDSDNSGDSDMETDDKDKDVDKNTKTPDDKKDAPKQKNEKNMDKLLSKPLDWIKWCADLKL